MRQHSPRPGEGSAGAAPLGCAGPWVGPGLCGSLGGSLGSESQASCSLEDGTQTQRGQASPTKCSHWADPPPPPPPV